MITTMTCTYRVRKCGGDLPPLTRGDEDRRGARKAGVKMPVVVPETGGGEAPIPARIESPPSSQG